VTDIQSGGVVVVTGATRGIGRVAASRFARAGLHVALSGRDESLGREIAQQLRGEGHTAGFFSADITREDQVGALFEWVIETFGRIDFAFNNAGVSGNGRLADLTTEDFDRAMAVNTRGLWLCLRAELRLMSAQRSGSIVNNASVHGLRTVFPGIGAYVASKHAALALTRVAAMEHAAQGVRVNAVAPGPIESDMLAASEATVGGATRWRALIPADRVGRPEEVADVALWLFSDGSAYVNGQVIAIDGGFTAT